MRTLWRSTTLRSAAVLGLSGVGFALANLVLARALPTEEYAVVTLVADGGWKYLSSGAWTDPIDEVAERATRINYW